MTQINFKYLLKFSGHLVIAQELVITLGKIFLPLPKIRTSTNFWITVLQI